MAGNKSVFQDALKKASNAAWDQRWDTAIKEYRRALAEFPEDVSARSGLALAYQESNKLQEAITEYQRLAKTQPGDPVPLAHVAVLLERLNRKSEAADVYMQVGDIYNAQKQMNRAVEAWRKVTMLQPDRMEPHEKLAASFVEAGHSAPAAREWFALAKLAQKSGDFTRALEYVERTLAIEPENTQAKFLLSELTGHSAAPSADAGSSPVEVARRSAMARLASSVLEENTPWQRAESQGADEAALLSRAIEAQDKGHTREAIQAYEELLQMGVTRAEVLFNLATLYQANLRHAEAISLLMQTVRNPQYAVASQYALGQSYRTLGNTDEALEHFLQATKLIELHTVTRAQVDQVIQVYESLSECYLTKSDAANAELYRKMLLDFLAGKGWDDKAREVREHIEMHAVTGAPLSMQQRAETPEAERVVMLLRSSAQYLAEHKYNAASEFAYQAIELAPNYLPAHVQIAEVSVASGRVADAMAKYDMLAETAEARRDLPNAISFYKQALTLGADDVSRRAKLIDVLVQTGNLPEALDEYANVGTSLAESGQLDKAASKYSEALTIAKRASLMNNSVRQIQRQLATTYLKLGAYDKALALYREIANANPEDDEVQYYLVDLYLRQGRETEAERELEQLLARHADSPEMIGKMLTALADELPDNVMIQRTLAEFFKQHGQTDKALEILDALGDRLLNAGKHADAVAVIEDIVALSPPQVDDYRRLLLELREPQTE